MREIDLVHIFSELVDFRLDRKVEVVRSTGGTYFGIKNYRGDDWNRLCQYPLYLGLWFVDRRFFGRMIANMVGVYEKHNI